MAYNGLITLTPINKNRRGKPAAGQNKLNQVARLNKSYQKYIQNTSDKKAQSGLISNSLNPDPIFQNEILAGQALLNQKRAEYAFNHHEPARPVYKPIIPKASPDPEPEPIKPTPKVKIWPELILRALQVKQGGAYRLYFLCKALDKPGSGDIKRPDLLAYCDRIGLNERQRRRWLSAALGLGLMIEHKHKAGPTVYSLVSLARAAILAGCEAVGKPASLASDGLIKPGWRALVWGAYLSTLHERPISQKVKAALTGVDERTQRNYQAAAPGEARRNFAFTRLLPEQIDGAREVRGHHFLAAGEHVLQRLPDIRLSPEFVTPGCRGRSRKAQKVINANKNGLSIQGRAKGIYLRLFCDSPKQTKATQRQIRRADLPPWDMPQEIFEARFCGLNSNLWASIPTGEAML